MGAGIIVPFTADGREFYQDWINRIEIVGKVPKCKLEDFDTKVDSKYIVKIKHSAA